MTPRTPTDAVYRHLLDDPDMPATVREWVTTEPDREQRAVKFACALAEDFIAEFRHDNEADDPRIGLHNALTRMALDAVNWRRVALALLKRFTRPVVVACRVPPAQAHRWAKFADVSDVTSN